MDLLISIENFVKNGIVSDITSPRTLEACLRQGVQPAELMPRPRSYFKAPSLTDKMVNLKFHAFEEKRQNKINMIRKNRQDYIKENRKNMRQTNSIPGSSIDEDDRTIYSHSTHQIQKHKKHLLLESGEHEASLTSSTEEKHPENDKNGSLIDSKATPKKHDESNSDLISNTDSSTPKKTSEQLMLEKEMKRLELVRKKQQKELEGVIEREAAAVELQKRLKKVEEEEVHKQKLKLKHLAEQQKIAEMKAKQIKAAELRAEEAEAERVKEILRKDREHEEKLAILAVEAERRKAREVHRKNKRKVEKAAADRLKAEHLQQQQFLLAEETKQRMYEREQKILEQIQQKKELKRLENIKEKQKALEKIEFTRRKFQERNEQKKKEFDEKERSAYERALQLEALEAEKVAKALEERERKNKKRDVRLNETIKARSDHIQDIININAVKEERSKKTKLELDEQLHLKMFETTMKLQDRIENVEKTQRLNVLYRIQVLKKIDEGDQMYEKMKAKRKELFDKNQLEEKKALFTKHEVSNAMNLMRVTNDFTVLEKIFKKSLAPSPSTPHNTEQTSRGLSRGKGDEFNRGNEEEQ